MKIITKYENRKLYDSVESKYVGVLEVYKMYSDGLNFVVVDKKTNKNITKETLKSSAILLVKKNKLQEAAILLGDLQND